MDGQSSCPAMVLQLPLGQIAIEGLTTIGRATRGMPDDPNLSRQHAVIAFEPHTHVGSLLWMAKRRGRLRSNATGRFVELDVGAQHALFPNDVITLLADSGKHVVLVQVGVVCTRPPAGAMDLLKSVARADAHAAARQETRTQTQAAQRIIDARQQTRADSAAAANVAESWAQDDLCSVLFANESVVVADSRALYGRGGDGRNQRSLQPQGAKAEPAQAHLFAGCGGGGGNAISLGLQSLPQAVEQHDNEGGACTHEGGVVESGSGSGLASHDGGSSGIGFKGSAGDSTMKYVGSHATRHRGGSRLNRAPWRGGVPGEDLEFELRLRASHAAQATDRRETDAMVVDLSFMCDGANRVVHLEPFGVASSAGLQVGDVVSHLNGEALQGMQTLVRALREQWVMAGDEVRLGVQRDLTSHVEAIVSVATGVTKAPARRPPDSPRMLPRDKTGKKERRAAWVAAGRPRPYRDPYNGQLIADTFCANGGAQGRML